MGVGASQGRDAKTRELRVMQGKRLVFIIFGAILIFSVMYLAGSATFVRTKADVCRGYYDAAQQQTCAATATAGPPPNLQKYH